MIEGCCRYASWKRSRSCFSASPTHLESTSAPFRMKKATGLPALADDSGIEIDALDGAPGVYTADWAETPTGRDFVMAMTKTHERLVASGVPAPHTARFCCTLVLAWPDGHDEVFPGVMKGELVWPMRGDQGHGYDPIFQPEGYVTTFGEMDRDEKNRISHRADAFRKLVAALDR